MSQVTPLEPHPSFARPWRSAPLCTLSAPSRVLLTPAEMLVVERKRVPYFAAGSGGMQEPNGLSAGGVRLLPLRERRSLGPPCQSAQIPQRRNRPPAPSRLLL